MASLRISRVSWWYSASLHKKSYQATDMPALRQEEMVSTECDLGPSVPTILVIAGKKLSLDRSRMDVILIGSSSSTLFLRACLTTSFAASCAGKPLMLLQRVVHPIYHLMR